MPTLQANRQTVTYAAYGVAWTLFTSAAPEIVLSGPAGTGKSRACLEKLNYIAENYPGVRLLMLRKTRRSLTESGMVTLRDKVLLPSQRVIFHSQDQQYRYPNGSIIAVGGLDKPGKIMSSEWDIVYVQEATELLEHDWESITTRLRNGKGPYHQLIADCNPDAPTHWLKQRSEQGKTLMLESRHEDNPTVTPDYLAKLDALSGVRLLRLRHGIWAAAEGMVYQDAWDRAKNVIDRFPIPREWPRYLAIDFGYSNPFVCQFWAKDTDGRMYLYREIYMTHRLVEDHARDILRFAGWKLDGGRLTALPSGDPLPRAVYADHDAEGRATLEKHLGCYIMAAQKSIQDGIQAVATRMRPAGDGKPRLYILRDALAERDVLLADKNLPASSLEEIESYVWDIRGGRKKGEEPVDANNHGMDAMRYLCYTHDGPFGRVGSQDFSY